MQFNRYSACCYLTLLLSAAAASSVADDSSESESFSKWYCDSTDLCLPEGELPPKGGSTRAQQLFESQRDCRLSCGKYGSIWPMPTGDCSLSHDRVHFDPWKVRFNVVAPNPVTTQFLRETNRLFVSNLLKECTRNCTLTSSKEVLVKATVNDSSLLLDWTTDESYMMVVRTTDTASFVDIKASTVYGARHAFETLSNLVTGSLSNGLLLVSAARIHDSPVYPHRGLLLDTARNFVPLRYIRSTLDAMAASKLNVLHWHVVDTHSFPLEITRVPEMQRYGAYSTGQTYSRSDAVNLVKYARLRGIRIILEIDGPSHAGNGWQWGPSAGLGNMSVCLNRTPWRSFCVQPPCGQLNPLNDHMYRVLKEILEDVAELGAPEETIHMGGDEVYVPCWNHTEEITSEMKSRGYDLSEASFLRLWSQFHQRNVEAWDEITRRMYPNMKDQKPVIIWSSRLTDPQHIEQLLPKERFIIQTWVGAQDSLNRDLLQRGYRLLISTKDAWYLDHGFWGSTNYYSWRKVYDNVLPIARGGGQVRQVLGGEVCMWSEYVDQNSLEPRIWPRAGAAAERLWSNPKSAAYLAQRRFYRYRERLIARGIHPDAVIPHWCVLHEGQCL
ncbi:chitooligosaccharidolytic beta-N-acetylglucosaminidase isoform X3 [Drosophila innubila]|uniref:chitooligosaccharidolytic beta-N-acetylglucosaminidase isoform X3 n=1 Tax=Drosophila innubila TaxID=198719 RepID=UPI00148C3E55|nr:chitooligosaccharidolytic beta-N-acetylglucosaminidase isoform X3 [Drosophila innubila]